MVEDFSCGKSDFVPFSTPKSIIVGLSPIPLVLGSVGMGSQACAQGDVTWGLDAATEWNM